MLRDGCALRIGPVLAVSAPLVLAGTGPGNGTLSPPVTLAPGTQRRGDHSQPKRHRHEGERERQHDA